MRLQLLTTKPILYVCNVDESCAKEGNEYSAAIEKMAAERKLTVRYMMVRGLVLNIAALLLLTILGYVLITMG